MLMGSAAVEVGERPPAELAEWQLAHAAYPDVESAARERAQAFIGELALETTIQPRAEVAAGNDTTLRASIEQARQGDLQAKQRVRVCVSTDVAERLFKARNQTEVEIEVSEKGKFGQGAIDLTNVHANTLIHCELNEEMYQRTADETGNLFVFEALHAMGVLDDNYAAIMSLASDDEQTIEDFNFSKEAMTCSIQLLDMQGTKGKLKTGFVAGRTTPDSPRHDLEAFQLIAQRANDGHMVCITHGDSVRYVWLIPKAALPNDLDDLIELWDDATAEVTSEDPNGIFYGEAKPRQDYRAFGQFCRHRNASFKDIVEIITDQLITESSTFTAANDANKRLDELSDYYCLERSIEDHSIDSHVFGSVAARYIEVARLLHAKGDHDGAQQAVTQAHKTSTSSSCPGRRPEATDSTETAESEDDEKEVTVTCPFCEARVKIKPCAKTITCSDCRAKVHNGKVVFKGNGGTKRRQELQRQAEELAQNQAEERLRRQVEAAFQEAEIASFEQAQAQQPRQSAPQLAMAGV